MSFFDRAHLVRALTHISALAPTPALRRADSYQRLKFSGDRVLGLAIAAMLCAHFPDAEEGELSRRLAVLVRRKPARRSRAKGARATSCGSARGSCRAAASGNRRCSATSANPIIGAVFLDGGYAAAQELVARAFSERMRNPTRPLRDPKTMLQEWAQARGFTPPAYTLAGRSGRTMRRISSSRWNSRLRAGRGARRLETGGAEQAAAQCFLAREGVGAKP